MPDKYIPLEVMRVLRDVKACRICTPHRICREHEVAMAKATYYTRIQNVKPSFYRIVVNPETKECFLRRDEAPLLLIDWAGKTVNYDPLGPVPYWGTLHLLRDPHCLAAWQYRPGAYSSAHWVVVQTIDYKNTKSTVGGAHNDVIQWIYDYQVEWTPVACYANKEQAWASSQVNV